MSLLHGLEIIRSGHSFAQATTDQLSQHVKNCDLTGLLELDLKNKYKQ